MGWRTISCLGLVVVTVLFSQQQVNAQLAAVFDKAEKTSQCGVWSSWGNCIWTVPVNGVRGRVASRSNLYLDQVSRQCNKHWFFTLVKTRYGDALNNFFNYLKDVTTDVKPCGMCSYRQSCGFNGPMDCHKAPWETQKRTGFLPFYVAEQVCTKAELGTRQNNACKTKKNILQRNGSGPTQQCRLWPSLIPKLIGIEQQFKRILYGLKWAQCVPDRYDQAHCRCCCYPFAPIKIGRNYVCRHIPGAPQAPGLGR